MVPGLMICRHGRHRAHMLKADAMGPKVPAIMGNADEANHQRLFERISVGSVTNGFAVSYVGAM